MKLYLFTLALCISLSANSQAPPIEWEKSYGGSNGDAGWSIIPTKDSGYVIAGSSDSNDGDVSGNHGDDDYWVIKINNSGTINWEKSYGGSLGDAALSIKQTIDRGYIIAGCSNSNNGDVAGNHGDYDFWIVKLDSIGDLIWEKSYGGSNAEVAYSIIQTTDGGYAIAGEDSSNNGNITDNHGGYDYWVVKLDSVGNLMWEKSLGGSGYDVAYSIIQTVDGGYAVAGISGSENGDVTGNHGGWDDWIVKLDSAGNIVWEKTYGGTNDDGAWSIIQTPDKGFAVAGYTASNDGDVTVNYGITNYWVLKLDSIGTMLWEKSFGGSNADYAFSIMQAKNGSYAVAGASSSDDSDVTGNHGGFDYWIINLDSAGDLLWEESLGGSQDDYAESIIQTNDESYIVAGYSDSNNGDVTGNHGKVDYWIAKLNTTTGLQEVDEKLSTLVTYPNPSSGYITVNYQNFQPGISLVFYNCLGQVIQQQKLKGAIQRIDVSYLAAGLYMVCIKNEQAVIASAKFIKD